MRVAELEGWAIDNIQRILKSAGLTNGNLLDPDEVKKTDDTLFWFKKNENVSSTNKKMYVIWSLASLTPLGYADDKVAVRNVYISIDFYTRLGQLHQTTLKTIDRVDEEFTKNGWQFERVAFDAVDEINGITYLRYSATIKI
jgi:hypothetical protein